MTAQGWSINATADEITFVNAPANGAAIAVSRFNTVSFNATQVWAFGAWSDGYGWPREVEYFSDRLIFASNMDQPQAVWMSKIGDYSNFGKSTPIVDDDAITFTINARQINQIRDLVPLDKLLILTAGGEWKVTGGQDNVLTPSTAGVQPQSFYGASDISTTVVGNTAIFLQDRGNVVRDLAYQFDVDGYTGNNLSIFSAHLLEGYSVVDVAYQQVPFNIVWLVRSDGVLLSLTYVKEQQIIGWARHDTRGLVESVCCIPEGAEDSLYLVVRRKVDGVWQRYVERMESRNQTDPLQPWFVDSGLAYDGRNAGSIRVTVLTPVPGDWSENVELSLLTSGGPMGFAGMSVGDQVYLEAVSSEYSEELGREVETVTDTARLRLTGINTFGYESATARCVGTLPEAFRGVPVLRWTKRVDTFSGLDHLEGLTVAVVGDGNYVGRYVVTDGTVTLQRPYGVVTIGLPYFSDMQTLDVNILNGESVRAKQKLISKVSVLVDSTRNIKVGKNSSSLTEVKPRLVSDGYENPIEPKSDVFVADVIDSWSQRGRVFVRQDLPLPITVLSIIPDVSIGSVT